ncbi:ATP-binding protein [Roseateles puraquae]|uniref:AAA+ ATPase domain-containing protein n=1 Tax=Roseateles puraquae TaxID=431059 RepID=A0A254N7B3_9BURK|nr:ATP-binding protein [Roseateles puraquae]MDG0857461.1 ATP-binding protein [Roseateles puraquae]OWQ98083.1 hypothetical protein CDO81_26955 [Roseateles puraquae]
MNATDGEPVGDADIQTHLMAFESVRKQHPRFKDAFHKTRDFAACGRASRVVILTGPTGVGKSTLGISLRKQAVIEAKEACEKDPSLVPAVLVTTTPPHGRSFNWKDFYVRTLEQLNEPLIDRKVFPGQLTMFETVPGMQSVGESLSTDPLRRHIERAFLRRKTKLWIIDEAHHILMCHDQRQLEFQFENLKSLADRCNATIVLIGTYKLLEIRDHSAQLMRRSQIVHFPAYRLELEEDLKAFKSCVVYLGNRLPIPVEQGILSRIGYFYNKTAGCIGILRDLFRDALECALKEGASIVTQKHFDASAQSNKAILRIMEESALGCVALEDVELTEVSALARMTPKDVIAHLSAKRLEALQPDVPGPAQKPRRSRSALPVGSRNPTRDKVGGAARVNAL